MKIDWAALGSVFGVSLVATVVLVGLFTLGIVGLSKQESASAQSGGSAVLARTGAYACFALCAAAVTYGIYLIVV
ncbi:hypothetical protein AR457_26640 [Streptomyces agglomeratus]|uniref:Uncharacterized protein n=1 Tax=Streptomyces agglomeratus TaxID=285458 RepID=A0A1E5PD89_9ACTN|nr:hypothetical protein [Streptomyces agglomeratus]OEJ27511.1 hypothetical protein AS594_26515 [Streptomyces agglomeratus]OEJ38432.1 hypothetical protein BGK70_10015 [Streptomyces agglomeratus]OEJ47183.1 hypothetical protein AR457_26640 [Streptomyces agglomeratus]OEJ50960.1 hypothetical protein BGK72_09500 [Streptomyces agglomeratus]OEJ58330.1 hypothetical protein BGM19_10410 [Streptomyces agglomeratus]